MAGLTGLHSMAHKKSISEWEQLFKQFDKDSNGSLDVCELRDLLQSNDSNVTSSQIIETFIFLEGPQGDKRITLEEFTTGMTKLAQHVEKLTELFRAMDKDKSGFLEKDELGAILKKVYPNMSNDDCNQIFNDADKSRDGKISLDEFISACS